MSRPAVPRPRASARAPARPPSTRGARSRRACCSAPTACSTSPSRARASCASSSRTGARRSPATAICTSTAPATSTTSSGGLVQPAIKIPDGVTEDQIVIGTDGTVTAAGRRVGRLELVTVRAQAGLISAGDNAFVTSAASGAAIAAPRATSLTQGALESSNVDIAQAMVEIIESQRAFQLASKAIATADEMMGIANGVKR